MSAGYYRIYTPDGAVPSKTAFDPRNPYLGRIAVTSVPPPHKVGSLQRRLVAAEKLPAHGPNSQQLLLNANGFSKAAGMSTEDPVLLSAQVSGIAPYGTTPETAFALLLKGAEVEKVANARMIPARVPAHPRYLYYRLFTRMGEDTSNVRFNPIDSALGRIERTFLAPPHTADSIKHQIAKLEGKRIYAYAELYTSISAPQPIQNAMYLSLMQDDSPGSRENNPIILVQPERRAKLYNRPVEVILAYTVQEWGHDSGGRFVPIELAVGSRCVSDGVLVKKAIYCEEHRKWDCTCGRGSRSRSVSQVFCCEISGYNYSYKTYVPARNPVFSFF
ncbi:hypothetical protein C8R45DRAFT_1016629 [Mycena sanguinolenta]|nr:hypothetical protein C8R45DRAFT_1016629 [Mycena sanguinolenta]